MKRKNRYAIIALTLIMALLTGCGAAQTTGAAEEDAPAAAVLSAAVSIDAADAFTDRDLDPSYDAADAADITLTGESALCESENVTVSGSTVNITGEGIYVLRGTLRGTLIVDADKTDKVQLVLCGAEITAEGTAALYVRQADKVFLTLAEDSDNTLAALGAFTAAEESNIDAAVFSKDDLTMNGTGSLTVTASAGHGVVSKDDLVITGGTYTVHAEGHGFSGKESLRVADGVFTVTAGKDGFHAEDKDDAALGWFYIQDGTFTVTAQCDGFSAAQTLRLDGGDYAVTTGGGSATVSHTAQGEWAWGGKGGKFMPDGAATAPDDAAPNTAAPDDAAPDDAAADTVSAKGVKSGTLLLLGGGSYHMDCADDAFHSNGDMALTDGDYTLSTGDDGLHADGTVTVSGGTITIGASYEGIEGSTIAITGGDITLTASDDGLNASGGADGSGMGGYGGFAGGSFTGSDSAITISGGTLRVTADGDGIDSNGSLTVTGGQVYVSGPADNNNGALDYGTGASITGGTFAAAGSTGMAQSFGDESTQCAMLVSTGAQTAGTTVTLTDSAGKTLLTFTPENDYACVVLSCGDLVQGERCTVTAGSFTAEITMDSLLYSDVTGAIGGMNGAMGHGGQDGFHGGGDARPAKPFADDKPV